VSLFTANSDTLETLWPYAERHIRKVVEQTMIRSVEDIYHDLANGEKQLWLCEQHGVVSGIVITEIYATQRGNICCIWAASGDVGVEMLSPLFTQIEQWARSVECVALEIKGRRGWKRVLPGFKETAICLEKDLRQVH
jgi:hypothetical protein